MAHKNATPLHPDGKIDIHERQLKYERALGHLQEDDTLDSRNKDLILAFLRDCSLGKTIRRRSKKKLGAGRCLKYLGILKQLSQSFGKSFDEVTQRDMDYFIDSLESNRLIKRNGQPYSDATKCDVKKAIRKFWKWKDGQGKTYPDLVEWIDTSEVVKEVPALTRDEVERMIDATASPRDRAIIMILFDSGARAEEILNVRLRKEHLFWKEELGCYLIRLEYSKTKPRTISLPLSAELLKKWLAVHPARENLNAQLFPITYPALKMVVSRLGGKALNKRVTPHMLRHSSATFYANKLKNPYKMCYRYGWTMASNMVNRYLDREGILEEETAALVRIEQATETNRNELRLQEELAILRESLNQQATLLAELQKELLALRSGKGILDLILRLKHAGHDSTGGLPRTADEGKPIALAKNRRATEHSP